MPAPRNARELKLVKELSEQIGPDVEKLSTRTFNILYTGFRYGMFRSRDELDAAFVSGDIGPGKIRNLGPKVYDEIAEFLGRSRTLEQQIEDLRRQREQVYLEMEPLKEKAREISQKIKEVEALRVARDQGFRIQANRDKWLPVFWRIAKGEKSKDIAKELGTTSSTIEDKIWQIWEQGFPDHFEASSQAIWNSRSVVRALRKNPPTGKASWE